MKILTINHPINDRRVTNRANFAEAETFFDFDVVIIQPPKLPKLLSLTNTPEGIRIGEYEYNSIKNLWDKRLEEINAFLENNGILIVILSPFERVYSPHYNGRGFAQKCEDQWLDNYGWLPVHNWSRYLRPSFFVINGEGDGYKITNESNPFTEYIKRGNVRWQAYIEYFDGLNVFAEIIKNKIIGATVNLKNGKIIFLPTLQEKNDELLLGCIENSFETYSETPSPDWISEFILPKEKEIESEIKEIQEQLETIKKQEDKVKGKLKEITKFKKLLYETGKYQLEPIVRDAFRLLGFTVHDDYKPEPTSNIEIDAMIECKYGKAILEIKGTEKSIDLADFAQLTNKTVDDLKITNEPKKGILVGNGFRTIKHPKDRREDIIFGRHVKESAERQSVTLINTVELYELVRSILDGDKIDKAKLQQKILESNGICEFNEFIKEN